MWRSQKSNETENTLSQFLASSITPGYSGQNLCHSGTKGGVAKVNDLLNNGARQIKLYFRNMKKQNSVRIMCTPIDESMLKRVFVKYS